MKTILLASVLALATLTVTANSTTNNKKVSYSTLKAFQQQFGNVENIAWTEAADHMTKATFTSEGETVMAFFNGDGEFVATTVNRSINDLPVKLKTSVKNLAKDAEIVEIVELQGDSEHAFYVKLRNDAGERILKGYSNGYLKATEL